MDLDQIARRARKDPAYLESLYERNAISLEDMNTILENMKENELKFLKLKVMLLHDGKIHEPTEAEPRWWTYVRDDAYNNGRRKLARLKEMDLYSSIVNYYKDNLPRKRRRKGRFTLKTLYPEWLKYKSLRTEASTYISRIDCEWRRHYANSPIIEKDVRDLTKLQLENWAYTILRTVEHVKYKYFTATTIMRQVLDYAVDRDILEFNPFRQIHIDARHDFRRVVKPEPETQVFTPEEKDRMISHAWEDFYTNHKLRYPLASLAVVFQFFTGLRVGELCAVRFEDITGNILHVSHFIRLQDQLVDGTKTPAGVRDIPLPQEALDLIEFCRHWQELNPGMAGEYVFSGKENLKPRVITTRYDSFCQALDIQKRSSHKARKTYISTLIDAGINIDTVRRIAGHTDTRVTLQNYTFDRLDLNRRNQEVIKAVSAKTANT